MLNKEEVQEHLGTLRISVDPNSPFFGMASFDDLLSLPVEEQWQIWDSMPDDLRKMVNDYKTNLQEG